MLDLLVTTYALVFYLIQFLDMTSHVQVQTVESCLSNVKHCLFYGEGMDIVYQRGKEVLLKHPSVKWP